MRTPLNKQEIVLVASGTLEAAVTWTTYSAIQYGASVPVLLNGCIVGVLLFLPLYIYALQFERVDEHRYGFLVSIFAYLFPLILVATDSYLVAMLHIVPFQVRDLWLNLFVVYLLTYIEAYAFFVYRMHGPKGAWRFYFRRYAKPVFEDKVIMFLDIDGSTTIAERIGHKKFISLLNDFFSVISDQVVRYNGEIHEYVGDEIIIFWEYDKVRANEAVAFFQAAEAVVKERESFFQRKYGIDGVSFKAGLHAGPVVVGELGKYKRKIVFAGDTMNVTARLEKVSKQKGCRLVMTVDYLKLVQKEIEESDYVYLGKTTLRGKQREMELYCLP